ncbi:hypothetical protein Vretifemale_8781 [Volvox reticuliferus]|nr:hypothetical protein Vretifemale_8781 [Volvox reticuliferus]
MTAEDTADDAEVQTGSGALSSHNDGGAPAAGGAAIPRGPSPSCGEVTAAAVVQPQLQCTVWRQHSGSTVTSVTGPHGKSTQLHPRRTGPCLDASALSQDYSFLQAREASQSSTLNAMKVALWQTICLLARKLPLESAGGAARAVWQCMEQPHHHSNLRPLMQQALLALLDRWPEGVQSLLLPALRTYHTASYQVCVSVVIIGSLLLQRQMATQPAGPLAQQLLEALFPWALHHRHAVRVPVQTVIYLVLEKEQHRMAEQTTLLTDPLPESEPVVVSSSSDMPYGTADTANKELPCQPLQLPSQLSLGSLDGVRVFLGSNPEQVALRTRQALVDFGRFNLEFECSLEGLFGIREEVLMAVAAAGEALEVDPGYPSSWALHTRDRLPIDVLRALPAAVRSLGAIRRTAPADGGSTATATAAAGPTALRYNAILDALGEGTEEEEGFQEEEEEGVGVGEVRDGDEQMYGGEAAEDGRCLSTPAAAAGAPSYQLRPQLLCAGARCSSRGGGVAISAATALTAAADRLDALAAVAAAQCSRPTGLVVVASLLENVPNMAGLCRTCESLGCEALVLPSRGVISSEAFKRQAVTSERWLPLLEVGPRDLPAYLAEMRGRGYWLVGVEQAAGSVPLQAFIFPTHCLLLLGNEQSGVPQHLISALDACVEIPMLGVTRSLNAHVSGAMAVWQYVQQQQQRLQ